VGSGWRSGRLRFLGADTQNRYEIPEELIPADSRVEIDAKVSPTPHVFAVKAHLRSKRATSPRRK
jgi:hypothetical protein